MGGGIFWKEQVFEKTKSFDLYLIACDERKCDEVCNLKKNKTSEKNKNS